MTESRMELYSDIESGRTKDVFAGHLSGTSKGVDNDHVRLGVASFHNVPFRIQDSGSTSWKGGAISRSAGAMAAIAMANTLVGGPIAYGDEMDTYSNAPVIKRYATDDKILKIPNVASLKSTKQSTGKSENYFEDPFEVLTLRMLALSNKAFDNGEGVFASAINEGLKFIDLMSPTTKIPHVSAASDGELMFSWSRDEDYLEVSFYGDGDIYFYHRGSDEIAGDTDCLPFSGKSIPRPIQRLLYQFS